ncbi:restriction endonuclease subunit S [Vibrio parahaemolyticus]|uniref:restriction endonuclease subunit S n=1 Tax=Vibrio parahaemolyticus TaxID=670 RepID=UPI0004253746|nr:restriction endonuclease subunit S [Vibrio parahaemolyticus]EGQ8412423.1 restriction endonuclease subunit S [Vibrio parahaemolyticus]EGQ9446589.1 restriction endonuclease subunit S [Vibrio parahaemolyticus]EGQ9532936.1 restriction endonuclease subunit S [Vibrio parahaemolyticus]EHY0971207.1 restriction endonuclease subunit S [Vibrio parahaemolyticus]EHZ7336190.1 restriction endonuclease subunit S [Vibrio parahaemolyticus]
MSWPLVKLGTVIKFIRGVTFKPDDVIEPFSQDSIVVMRTKNVQVSGLDSRDLIAIPKSIVKREEQKLKYGDLLISSANSWELVGKVSFIEKLNYETTAGGFISIVRPIFNKIDERYLYHWVSSPKIQHAIRYCGRQTTNISNLDVERFKGLEIPLPPLAEQKRIAAILDKADAIRRKRQQAIELADEFLRAVFLDMFGDPVTNPKGWDISRLPSHGTFKNGLNFSKEDSGISLRYLGVGDFKSLTTITDMQSLGRVELNECPAKDYLLKNGDLVFVRSNGNKALVGRCISVYPDDEALTFSGFCIRYRVEDSEIEPEYLNYLLRTPSMKRAMLKGGQGANIQNINQKILSSLSIPLPPLQHQQVFCEVVKKFRKTMHRIVNNKVEADTLFGSLSQKAFSGML